MRLVQVVAQVRPLPPVLSLSPMPTATVAPDYADPLRGLAYKFVVSRSDRDSVVLLDVVADGDVGLPGIPASLYREEKASLQATADRQDNQTSVMSEEWR